MADISRRSLLLLAGVATVAAGGIVVASRIRPSGAMPDVDDLPVVAVPPPTDEPVEVVFCAGWDGRPVTPFGPAVARGQDAAGAQYAAVFVVGGKARAVVEVCWDAHHAEVWNLDENGRKYRGVAYRRWPDDRLRLFEVRSWDSGDAEPSFRARVLRDERTKPWRIDIEARQPGGTLQLLKEWPGWPEEKLPVENLAVPSPDGWAAVAGCTGPVTVRRGPDAVPDEFPWRAPRPLQPRHLGELVTDGARFRTEEGKTVTIARLPAGTVRLPSGRVIVADPSWLDGETPPFTATAPPGTYPVEIFRADGETVACRVTITGAPVASWELALRAGDHELELGDGEFFGNPVDAATLSVVDADGAAAYPEDTVMAAMADTSREFTALSDPATRTDLVIVSGWSDGSFPTWVGRASDGSISCYVIDFFAPGLADATPVR